MIADGFQVSRATVYNTLDLLIEAGLVRRITLGDGVARYERVMQANNHHHLICTRCGKVKEMKAAEVVGELLSRKPRSFEPLYYTLYIYGLCSRCAKAEKSATKENKKY
jgi:Fur family ferric uptake transcriptional regulator